jgi:hypothetical protein
LGVNSEEADLKTENVIISHYIPLKQALFVTEVTGLRMGELDLYD